MEGFLNKCKTRMTPKRASVTNKLNNILKIVPSIFEDFFLYH